MQLNKSLQLNNSYSSPRLRTASFTLIELLIVIGILAILTAAVVIVLNPTELLKQGRDSKRSTDIASIHKSIQLLTTQASAISLGTASTIAISLPDTSPTCANLFLPTLPSGYTYRCVPTASSTLINGSGWLPIDFTQSSIQNFSALPLDPTNTSSTGLYYTYMPTSIGTYELTTLMESEKGSQQAITDGGILPGVLEIGSTIAQTPSLRDRGLVGYWTFDEGSGITAYDRSGKGNNGTWNGTIGSQWVVGKVGTYAGNFNGSDNYINCGEGSSSLISGSDAHSYAMWINIPTTLNTYSYIISLGDSSVGKQSGFGVLSTLFPYLSAYSSPILLFSNFSIPSNTWIHMVFVYNNGVGSVFYNGLFYNSGSINLNTSVGKCRIGSHLSNASFGTGLYDDIRVYNRVLSAAEILSIYNATK